MSSSTGKSRTRTASAPMDLLRRISNGSAFWLFAVQVAIFVAFSVVNPDAFPTLTNVRNVAIQASILLVMSVGMTFVIATAGIDLSVGGVLVFASVVSAKTMGQVTSEPTAIVLGLVVAIVAGAAWGVLNGFLVAKAHVPPLIVTLGTLGMSLGAAQLVSSGTDITTVPPSLTNTIGFGRVVGIPWLVIIGGAVALFGFFLLRATKFGRHTIALGSNAEALRRAGVQVDWVTVRVYGLAGLLAGLAGFLSLAQFSATTLNGHGTDNLQAVTAVVLGGTSLFGGIASVAGTVVGVLIPATLQNGFVISGVQPFWQQIAIGAVLIAAVYLDYMRRARRSGGGRS